MSTETRSHAYTQIPGHGLQAEGKAFYRDKRDHRFHRSASRIGFGLCSCGAHSDLETTDAARKRWHKAHKTQALSQYRTKHDPDPKGDR